MLKYRSKNNSSIIENIIRQHWKKFNVKSVKFNSGSSTSQVCFVRVERVQFMTLSFYSVDITSAPIYPITYDTGSGNNLKFTVSFIMPGLGKVSGRRSAGIRLLGSTASRWFHFRLNNGWVKLEVNMFCFAMIFYRLGCFYTGLFALIHIY